MRDAYEKHARSALVVPSCRDHSQPLAVATFCLLVVVPPRLFGVVALRRMASSEITRRE